MITRAIAWSILGLTGLILIAISWCNPGIINNNDFLQIVLKVEIINILAVTTTVTLGVASILYFRVSEFLYMAYSRKEEAKDPDRISKVTNVITLLNNAQSSIRRTSFLLIITFGLVFISLVIKGWLPEDYHFIHALIGVFSFLVFLGNVLSMIEIHAAIFRMPPLR